MVILRKKTGIDFNADTNALNSYKDSGQIGAGYRQAMAFAIANGVLTTENDSLQPQGSVTRSEILRIIERVLILAGEL